MKNENLFTVSAAARLVQRSEETMRRVADEGKLPCVRTTTGRRLFRREDLEKFLQDRQRGEPIPAA